MAAHTGMVEFAEPAELVARSIIDALESGDFHAFPDTLAKQVGSVYHDFASNIVEANLLAG
jgi:hypothetical protein